MGNAACLVCGGVLRPAPIASLLRCPTCRFVTADMALTPEEQAAIYDHRYFAGAEYADYVADRAVIEKSFQRRLRQLLAFVPDARHKRLFEVGCAHGFFLHLARSHFAAVEGIDISCDAVRFASSELGLPVRQGDLLSCALPSAIDVACLWDTIEHLPEPHRYLERLSAHMPKGAVLAITTGDIDSWVARWRGPKWRQIHPPTHLQYFSRDTLSRLLGNYGFTVLSCSYDGMYRSLEMMSYIVFAIKQKRPAIHYALKRLGLLRFNLYINLRDIMFVIAQK